MIISRDSAKMTTKIIDERNEEHKNPRGIPSSLLLKGRERSRGRVGLIARYAHDPVLHPQDLELGALVQLEELVPPVLEDVLGPLGVVPEDPQLLVHHAQQVLLLLLGVVPVPLPAERRGGEGAGGAERVVKERLLGHLVVELGGVLRLAQQARVHVLVGLEDDDPDVHLGPEGDVARPDIVADLGGVGLVGGRQELGLAPLARGDLVGEDAVEVLDGEGVEVEEDDARQVRLRPDVELAEQVLPPREGEDGPVLVGGRVPGDQLQLAHDGALREQDVALLLGDEGRDEDDDGVPRAARLGVPEQAVDELLRREEVRVVHAVVARREVGREGELAGAVVVVGLVLFKLGDVEFGQAVLVDVVLEGEFHLVEGGVLLVGGGRRVGRAGVAAGRRVGRRG